MIVITGAAGFIASCLITKLNNEGFKELVLVDDFSRKDRERNYIGKAYIELVDRNDFSDWLMKNQRMTEFVFHIGARTDTTEFSVELFNRLNLDYSKEI